MTAESSPPKCSTCKPGPRLNYPSFFADAERRTRRGQKQRQCPECGLWRWPDEWRTKRPPRRSVPAS